MLKVEGMTMVTGTRRRGGALAVGSVKANDFREVNA